MLRDVEGLSTAEPATCLGIYAETVKTRLHRARALLRNHLTARMGVAAQEAFRFDGARCDRMVAAVMVRIGAARGGSGSTIVEE
jgi:RNA polymerase sigma-70 factor (ECF subfamily)